MFAASERDLKGMLKVGVLYIQNLRYVALHIVRCLKNLREYLS